MYRKKRAHLNMKWLLVLGMFLATLIATILLYPNIKHFQYSYQKGKPWAYETLYAPFRFSVKKTQSQIELERQKRLSTSTPYYDYQPEISKEILKEAHKNNKLSAYSLDKLKEIYNNFIIQSDSILSPQKTIYIVKDHISSLLKREDFKTQEEIRELFTTTTAYNELKNYIKPNLVYNKEKTNSLYNASNISSYLGEVQPNELIISKGELITTETFSILESLKREYSKRIGTSSTTNIISLGQLLFVFIIFLMLYIFLKKYRPHLFVNHLHLTFVLLNILFSVGLTRVALNFSNIELFVVPYILFALVIRTFIDSRVALFNFLTSILICSFIVPHGYNFLILQIPTGVIAILHLKHLNKRSQLLYTSLLVFISYSATYTAIFLSTEGQIQTINYGIFIRFLLNAIFLTIAYPFLYLLERTFGFLSDVTLLELSNTNTKLLRQLSQIAPGTFQHSMQMANIAEEAILEIGGNPLLIRTGALYHDIGKMEAPMYFTENQHGEASPHKKLSFQESSEIIIKHVEDGVKIAKKKKLPKQLIAFIQTHHGRGKAEYFYRSSQQENPNITINEEPFTYPGPDPYTKEQAVLMMADACEAATRSLKEKSEQNIQNIVNKIITSQKNDGRFNNAPITLKDIETVKNIFVKKLSNIYHSRIAYPEKQEENK